MTRICTHGFESEDCPACNSQNVADQKEYRMMKCGDGSDRSAVTSRPHTRDDGVLTRVDSSQWSEAEWAIGDAMEKVERMGSSTAATDALVLLVKAKDRAADHIEGRREDPMRASTELQDRLRAIALSLRNDGLSKFAETCEQAADALQDTPIRGDEGKPNG